MLESLERSFSEIKQIDRHGITFISGEIIVFRECVKQRYNSETCVAERDLFDQPPYFLFFTPDKPTKVIFNKKGLCSKSRNRKDFRELQEKILEFGYSSYDLS